MCSAASSSQRGHASWVYGVAFLPCGTGVVSVGEDDVMRVWDVARGIVRAEVEHDHAGFLSGVAVHATRRLLATGSLDASASVWLGD